MQSNSKAGSFEFLRLRMQRLAEADNLRQLRALTPSGIHLVESDGSRLVNFGSNDYLGIAAQAAGDFVLSGSGASALVTGWTCEHEKLANQIAEFEGTESAVVFPSGFAACSGTVAALAGPNDLILSDELNHASLIDGCRLSRADCFIYPHRDVACVSDTLHEKRDLYDNVWLITDSVFSMDGHVAPMRELARLATKCGAHLIVDEAHGTGVLGATGAGACEAYGVRSEATIRIGTLSKAVGAQGGFVAGPKLVIDYLVNTCRSLVFSTSLCPAAVIAAVNGLNLIRSEPGRRDRVGRLAMKVRESLGMQSRDEYEARVPIISVPCGENELALRRSRRLRDRGYFVPAIRPPTVPEGTARLRVSLSYAHTDEMVDSLISSLLGD